MVPGLACWRSSALLSSKTRIMFRRPRSWRRGQSAAILHHIDEHDDRKPSIILGDTNEWRPSNGCLRDFGAHHVPAPTGPSYHARMPVGALDRIFVSPELKIVAAGVHASPKSRLASDHLPIWAKLKG